MIGLVRNAIFPRHGQWGLVIGLAAAVLAWGGPVARAQFIFDPAADFSVGTNPGPGNTWSYGYASSPGQFTAFPLASDFGTGVPAWRNANTYPADYPVVFYNASGSAYPYSETLTLPPGQFGLHPGGVGAAVARLTLPAGGEFLLNAVFIGLESFNGGTTTDVHVRVNGTSVYDGTIGGYLGSATFLNYSFTASPGWIVDFVVGDGGNGFNGDTTSLTAIVVAVPEVSASAAWIAAGTVPMFLIRRRRVVA